MVSVHIKPGKELEIRHPDRATSTFTVANDDGANRLLRGIAVYVRDWPWVIFPEYRGYGLPIKSRTPLQPSVHSKWDDDIIDVPERFLQEIFR